jgi:hypothetical protein
MIKHVIFGEGSHNSAYEVCSLRHNIMQIKKMLGFQRTIVPLSIQLKEPAKWIPAEDDSLLSASTAHT